MNIIDKIDNWIGKIFSYTLLVLLFLVVLEVVQRRFFNQPTAWSFDLTKMLFGAHFMITSSFVLLHKGHISVDLISHAFSKKTNHLLNVIGYLIFYFPFTISMLITGTKFAANSWMRLETTFSTSIPIPLYPIKTVIPITAVLLILQGLSVFIKEFKELLNKGEKSHDES